MRVLTLRELNRATLARQFLLERRRLSALSVIERLAGMQAQWPQAPYVGLWTRIPAFRRETLERAIRSGKVVKATVMRGTLHLVTARDYGMFFAALHEMRAWADDESMALGTRLAPELRAMFDDGPLTFQQVLARPGDRPRHRGRADAPPHVVCRTEGGPRAARARDRALRRRGRRRCSPRSPNRRRSRRRPRGPSSCAATSRRSAPRARADLADWSGMRVSDLAEALDSLEPLRRFRDERGRELLDLPRAPLPDASTPAPVRFLPKWDNVLLGFADRTRVLPEEYRKTVIAKNGDVAQTFLVDGVVAGTWREEKGKVRLDPFAPSPPRRPPRGRGRGVAPRGVPALMLIGAHCSGGVKGSIEKAVEMGADAVQLFTQSPRAWKPPNPDPEIWERFREQREEAKLGGVLCHAIYLVNLAAPNDEVYEKSIATMRSTMQIACGIEADGVVFHVGSHLGAGFEQGLERAVPALEQVLELCSDRTWLLMENSAGTGGTIGRSIEELAALYERLDGHPRLGLCLDSCHLYASGLRRHGPRRRSPPC